MKLLVLLAALLVPVEDSAAPNDVFEEMTFEQALAKAKELDKLVFVDFYTTWCAPCKKLDRTTWKDERVRAWLSQMTVALKVDAEKQRELAAEYGVEAYPSLVFIRPDRSLVDILVGYRDAETFLEEAVDLLAGRGGVDRAREALEEDDKNPTLRMKLAKELARRGEHEEALEHYLWCWDHGPEHRASFVGVRGSFLLSDIQRLGRKYPSALDALRGRRDACEKEVLAARGGFAQASDLAALNRTLDENERTLRVYDALPADGGSMPEDVARMRSAMLREVFDLLLEARRYEDLLSATDYRRAIESRYSAYNETVRHDPDDEQLASFMKQWAVTDNARYVEVLLGTNRNDEAEEVAAELIEFSPSYRTFDRLARHALRAEADGFVAALREQAGERLEAKEIRRLERMIAREQAR